VTTIEATAPGRAGRLLRVLGVAFGIAVIIGNTIGVGILRTPGDVAARLPSSPLFLAAWVLGGIYALLGAVSVAELGTMSPRSGGQYVFVRRALGEYPGFVVGWSDWISSCGSTAAVSIVTGEYLGVLIPTLAGHESLIASLAVIIFSALQWRGVRWGDVAQQILSLAKALALVGLVAVAFALGEQTTAPAAAATVPRGFGLFLAFMLALQGVIFTYDGWTGVIYFGGEVRNPGRDIPRSMIGGVLLVLGIYLSLNLAFLYLLPISRMANEPFVAGAAAEAIFGARGDTVIRTIMVVSAMGAINAIILMSSRVPLAMAGDGLMLREVARVNRGGTPTAALLLSGAIALGFIVTGTFERVLALLAFFFVASYAMSFLSVFVLRRREPDAPRPYRAWGYPWTTGLVLVGSVAFLAGQLIGDTRNTLWSLALIGLSYPVYRFIRRGRAAMPKG